MSCESFVAVSRRVGPVTRLVIVVLSVFGVTSTALGAGVPLSCDLPRHEKIGAFDRVFELVPDDDVPTSGTVLLLHEITGITDKTCQFAEILRRKGFRVYVPEMFSPGSALVNQVRLAHHDDWDVYGTGGNSRVIQQLRSLAEEIAARSGSQIGVIGLCLTGIFPLTMLEPDGIVAAAVVSQPSLPLTFFSRKKKRDLGLSAKMIDAARDSGVPILGFRFDEDKISPQARWDHLREAFPSGGSQAELLDFSISRDEWAPYRSKWSFFPGHRAHSVLTGMLPDSPEGDPDHPSVLRVGITVEYLRARLAGRNFDCASASLPCR